MHRSAFRQKITGSIAPVYDGPSQHPSGREPYAKESAFESMREQIETIGDKLAPMRMSLEAIVSKQQYDSKTIPDDLGSAVRSIIERMDRMEQNQHEAVAQFSRIESAFSNTLLELVAQVEKISGGKESSFSLAYSMDKLIGVLDNQKFRIIRDNNGDMVEVETG